MQDKTEIDNIKLDIRSCKELTNQQLKFVFNLSHSDKCDIIILYNEMMKYITDIMNEEPL